VANRSHVGTDAFVRPRPGEDRRAESPGTADAREMKTLRRMQSPAVTSVTTLSLPSRAKPD